MDPQPLLTQRPHVADERTRAAQGEWNSFTGFCAALRLDSALSDSCVVYLTHLLESERLSNAQLDRRLTLLDRARGLDGLQPWRADPHMRLFMKGLLRTARLHNIREQSDPLYREHLAALIEETLRPTPKQTRLRAAVLLFHQTTWPAQAVSRLKWSDIDLRRRYRTTVSWPDELPPRPGAPLVLEHPDGLHPLRDALDRARELGEPSPYVTWPPADYKPNRAPFLVIKALRALEHCDGDPVAAVHLVCRSPEQVRNRAAMVLGFGAALTTCEALSLRQRDVAATATGLLVSVPGRRRAVGIPRDPGTVVDPLSAWEDWVAEAASWGLDSDEIPALLDAHKLGVHPHAVGERGLNRLVQNPAKALRMTGTFGWQSLRWGAIRTAIRDNERSHHVAALAATNLDTIGRHQQREQLITHSVAGQLGL